VGLLSSGAGGSQCLRPVREPWCWLPVHPAVVTQAVLPGQAQSELTSMHDVNPSPTQSASELQAAQTPLDQHTHGPPPWSGAQKQPLLQSAKLRQSNGGQLQPGETANAGDRTLVRIGAVHAMVTPAPTRFSIFRRVIPVSEDSVEGFSGVNVFTPFPHRSLGRRPICSDESGRT
jgi:hypothetical protein